MKKQVWLITLIEYYQEDVELKMSAPLNETYKIPRGRGGEQIEGTP